MVVRASYDHLMVALGMDDVQGPAEVINGIPLKVATPLSSVKRCCNDETHMRFICPILTLKHHKCNV